MHKVLIKIINMEMIIFLKDANASYQSSMSLSQIYLVLYKTFHPSNPNDEVTGTQTLFQISHSLIHSLLLLGLSCVPTALSNSDPSQTCLLNTFFSSKLNFIYSWLVLIFF